MVVIGFFFVFVFCYWDPDVATDTYRYTYCYCSPYFGAKNRHDMKRCEKAVVIYRQVKILTTIISTKISYPWLSGQFAQGYLLVSALCYAGYQFVRLSEYLNYSFNVGNIF